MSGDFILTAPVFVASLQEFKSDPAQQLQGYYHVCMGTLVTGLHLLTICSCVTVNDPQDNVFLIKFPRHFIAVAGTDKLSRIGARRAITNFMIHRFCGGIPRLVDMALAKIDHPWDPTPEFGVAPLGIDPEKSYFDYLIKTKSIHDCHVYTWINRESIEEDWKPYDKETVLDDKMTFTQTQTIGECYPFNITVNGKNVTVDKPTRDGQLCGKMAIGRGCGVDKGAPLICQTTNGNVRETFLAGIGLGGTKCYAGVASLSLFQGFQDSLSFLRLYLALDDTFLTDKRPPADAARAVADDNRFSFDEDKFSLDSISC